MFSLHPRWRIIPFPIPTPSLSFMLYPFEFFRLYKFVFLFNVYRIGFCQEFGAGHNFCDPNPCQFGGSCRSVTSGYVCNCPPGSLGYNCEKNIDDCSINSTSSNITKCQLTDSNAKCTDLVNGFKCTCSAEYHGELCDISGSNWGGEGDTQLIKLLIEDPELFDDLAPFFVENKRTKMSWTADELFVWASFAGAELDLKSELIRWNDPLLGNCFTFGHSGKILEVADIGENYELQAVLRVHEEDYLPWIKTASLNIFVQQKNEHIFPNSVYYSSSPGSQVQLLLKRRTNTRLGDVYGSCANLTTDVNTFYYPGTYTVTGCLQSCYQNQVHLSCGCTDPRFLGISNISVCGVDKGLCVLNVTQQYGTPLGWANCACPEQCHEQTIDALWYSADFPTNPAECWGLSAANLSRCLNLINDQLSLSVFFGSNVQEEYNEIPAQTFNDYLLVAGGITGIIAGFSFISIIEFIFFCYRTFLTFCTNEYVTAEAKELLKNFVDEEDADFDVFVEPPKEASSVPMKKEKI